MPQELPRSIKGLHTGFMPEIGDRIQIDYRNTVGADEYLHTRYIGTVIHADSHGVELANAVVWYEDEGTYRHNEIGTVWPRNGRVYTLSRNGHDTDCVCSQCHDYS